MRKIDWNKFLFISKGECFVKDTEANCKCTYTKPCFSSTVGETSGLFMTNNENEETCTFNDFDVCYNGFIVNELSYLELFELMNSND